MRRKKWNETWTVVQWKNKPSLLLHNVEWESLLFNDNLYGIFKQWKSVAPWNWKQTVTMRGWIDVQMNTNTERWLSTNERATTCFDVKHNDTIQAREQNDDENENESKSTNQPTKIGHSSWIKHNKTWSLLFFPFSRTGTVFVFDIERIADDAEYRITSYPVLCVAGCNWYFRMLVHCCHIIFIMNLLLAHSARAKCKLRNEQTHISRMDMPSTGRYNGNEIAIHSNETTTNYSNLYIAHWFICHIWPCFDFWTKQRKSVSSIKACKFNKDRWQKKNGTIRLQWLLRRKSTILQLISSVFRLSQPKRNILVKTCPHKQSESFFFC